jgi:Na+/melibiose symporter-like transporter
MEAAALAYWLIRRKRENELALLDVDLFRSPNFRLGITEQMQQQLALGGAMIVLPIFFQMVLEYNAMKAGLSIAPLSLSMFAVAMMAGKKAGIRRPAQIVRLGFLLLTIGVILLIVVVPRADSGWYFVIPLIIAGSGLGLLVSQLNNYTLAPIPDERISEAAGVNSAAGQFGLSLGLALAGALMLAALSFLFTNMAEDSSVLDPSEQHQVADALEDDAQVMSNTQLDELITDVPPEKEAEIIRINSDARERSLQVALIVPLLAGIGGLLLSLRMILLPDVEIVPGRESVLGA